MKTYAFISAFAIMLLHNAPVWSADNKLNVESSDTTNPITGTNTKTKKYELKRKRADGKSNTTEIKRTEKTTKAGDHSVTVEKEQETPAKAE